MRWVVLLLIVGCGTKHASQDAGRDAGPRAEVRLDAASPVTAQPVPVPDYALKLPAVLPGPVRRLYERCGQGDNVACVDAAALFLHPSVAPDRPAIAAQLLENACQKSHLPACAELGRLHLSTLGVPYDLARAKELMERACRSGDPHGCGLLGDELVSGRHFVQDLVRGRSLLEQACNGSDARACLELANAMAVGLFGSRELENDALQKARTLASTNCQHGHYHDCQVLLPASARLNAAAYHRAQAIVCRVGGDCGLGEYDFKAFTRLCREGHVGACIELAHPRGIPLDTPQAFEFLGKACLAGVARGCERLAHSSQSAATRAVLKQACEEGELSACDEYAGAGDTSKDPEQHERFKFACSHQSAKCCLSLLQEQMSEMERSEFVRAMEALCPSVRYRVERRDLNAQACATAADAYRLGDGVPRDASRALELYRRACFPGGSIRFSSRSLSACGRLAELYDSGEGIERDQAMATAIWAGACHAGEANACATAAERVSLGTGISPSPATAAALRNHTGPFHMREPEGAAGAGSER